MPKNFSCNAKNYNEYAILQKEFAQKICELLEEEIFPNHEIIDLGSGSSFIAKNLIKKNPKQKITEIDLAQEMLNLWQDRPQNVITIKNNIQNLDFLDKKFDIIISSFALQWLDNFDDFLINLKKIMDENSTFIFCLPLKNSLSEIKLINKKSNCNFYFKQLPKFEDIILSLENKGFTIDKKIIEIKKEKYKNAVEFLKNIKKIGANFSENKNCVNKKNLKKFNDLFLEEYNNILSWEVGIFVVKN